MTVNDFKIVKLETVTSTNDYLKDLVKRGECEPVVVIADVQTRGKGTKNRSFISQKGGLYLSLLLKPEEGINPLMLTPATAVAVSDTIKSVCHKSTAIKWVNDIYLQNKKVCGILCESVVCPVDFSTYIIVGIGVNLFEPIGGFDNQIKDIAISILHEDIPGLKNDFVKTLLDRLNYYYSSLEQRVFFKDYRRLSLLIGRDVIIGYNNEEIPVRVLDIDEECRLVVELQDKTVLSLSSGDVTVNL